MSAVQHFVARALQRRQDGARGTEQNRKGTCNLPWPRTLGREIRSSEVSTRTPPGDPECLGLKLPRCDHECSLKSHVNVQFEKSFKDLKNLLLNFQIMKLIFLAVQA